LNAGTIIEIFTPFSLRHLTLCFNAAVVPPVALHFPRAIFGRILVSCGMTIWILALVLLASGAGLGFRQGAIRVGISFIGIVTATLFAGLLGNQLKPLLPRIGVQNPTLIWLLAPLIAFILILVVFKAVGFFVHRKMELFYKYKAGDLRQALWKRLNSRLGLCLGLLNGTAYLLLVSIVLYDVCYWTVQTASGSDEPFALRALNRLGSDLEATGLADAAHAVAPLPAAFYQLADLAGLLRQNPQLNKRLEEYPAFLSLAERSEFTQLGQDSSFQNAWQSHAPLSQLLKDSQVVAMLKNSKLTATILGSIQENWSDLNTYLQTGNSPKYGSEKILGRWKFNVNVSVGSLLIAHPKITPADIKALRGLWSDAYAQTEFIASADHQAFLDNLPRFSMENGMATVAERMNFQGQWANAGADYDVSLSGNGQNKSMTAHTDGLRLTVKSGNDNWVFDRE
jgi:uncharacterized membrane protein required for colicin V production